MTVKSRTNATVKKTKSAAKAPALKKENAQEEKPMSLFARIMIVILTSYVAEKIWTNRTIVSDAWYSENQTPTQQNLIVIFEFIVAMGMLFFMGIAISLVTMWLQKKVGL